MPRIATEHSYNGASERIARLGLSNLLAEVRQILIGFELRVREEKDANGGAAVRKLIDERFKDAAGWKGMKSGGIDWVKCLTINGVQVCVGVEIQFSARSDLLVVDIIHLRQALRQG